MLGVLTQISLYFDAIWLSFILLGLFAVSSFNAIRSVISHGQRTRQRSMGFFYVGTALSGALGALLIDFLWQHYSETTAVVFSIVGAKDSF